MREYARLQTAILLRRLAYEIGQAGNTPTPGVVHDLRVAIRRLAVCLRLFARFYPRHSAKRIRHRLDTLMEAAATVRDLDITLELLGKAGIPSRSRVAEKLREERRKASNRLSREIRSWKSSGFSRKWRSRLAL